MNMFRKTLVAISAVILLSSGASLALAQTQVNRGSFRSTQQII